VDALFYPETMMQTTSQSSTYTFNLTRIYHKKRANCMNNMFFINFTTCTVTFYHILHHLKAGNQQNNLFPVCKLIILIIFLMMTVVTKRIQNISGINTTDKVSIWDNC